MVAAAGGGGTPPAAVPTPAEETGPASGAGASSSSGSEAPEGFDGEAALTMQGGADAANDTKSAVVEDLGTGEAETRALGYVGQVLWPLFDNNLRKR